MSRRIRLELARSGVADNGTPVPEKVLDEIVETWADVQDAPVVLGHPPKHDRAPRFGSVLTVEKVHVRGSDIYVSDVDLHDALATAYDDGHFTKWSLQAKPRPSDGKYQLYSLGFLGGTPPALKKLRVFEMEGVELADGDDVVTIELSDPSAPDAPTPSPSLPDSPAVPVSTTAKPTDKTKKPASQEEVIADVDAAVDDENALEAAVAGDPAAPVVAKRPAAGETPAELRARIARLEADAERREKAEAGALVERTREAVAGQPLDVQEAAVELADQLTSVVGSSTTIELSDGDDKTITASPAEGFLRFLKTLKSPVEPGLIELGDLPGKAGASVADRPADGRKMARSI